MNNNPFGAITDYPSMLKKIGTSTFIVLIFCIAIIRENIPLVENWLSVFTYKVPILGIPLPLGTVSPAIVIAILTRIVKYHNALSGIFQIRKRFDVYPVLILLASISGAILNTEKVNAIEKKRKELMTKVFYKYVSSTKGKAIIDSHYITLALDHWSWYWVLLESISIIFVTSIVLVLFSSNIKLGYLLLTFVLIGQWILQLIRTRCIEYAKQEIEQILCDKSRMFEIKKVFDAL